MDRRHRKDGPPSARWRGLKVVLNDDDGDDDNSKKYVFCDVTLICNHANYFDLVSMVWYNPVYLHEYNQNKFCTL